MKIWQSVLALLFIAVVVTGLTRLRVDSDVFSLLPTDAPTVEGLRLFQEKFGSSHSLIVSIRSVDSKTSMHVTQSLAQELRNAGLTGEVIWRSPFQDNPEALAEFLAYLWFNQSPPEFADMARRFDDDQLEQTLARNLERMANSMNPVEVARLAHDPFSLTTIGSTISSSLLDIRKNPFTSEDGRLRILYVTFPGEQTGFWQYRNWLNSVNKLISAWQQADAAARLSTIRLTGNPVFVTEFGSRLLSDIFWAAVGTLTVIALLFWWVHRRWAPLLGLIALLAMTATTTVALGGLVFGTLNAVSLGFVAILMGLAVDYGLLLYQEQRTYPERSALMLRKVMAPSILWAAVTTATAFALVSRSSLPGLTQLGALVAIGIITAALLMLTLYVALLKASKAPARAEYELRSHDSDKSYHGKNRIAAWFATLILLAVSILILLNHSPGVQSGTANLQFEEVQARTSLEEIQREITGFGSELWLIIAGVDEQEVAGRLANAEQVLTRAKESGLVTRDALPTGLWPQPAAQLGNRETARSLVQRLQEVEEQAVMEGFTPEALVLTKAIFKVWSRYAELRTVAWPLQPESRWLFSQFTSNDNEQVLALGQIEVEQQVTGADVARLADELVAADGGTMVGWSLLTASLVKTMEHDVTRVVLPMAVALVVVLGLAYRDVRGIVLSFATLGFMMICLFAAMSVFGWSWNLMNITALPLLLGAGVDYSIHIQLALKRYGGDIRKVKRSVGNAILLCGASTAAAFGSLGLASNPGLASLGRVAALGIGIASVTAVFLLPLWWSTGQMRIREIE